MPTVKMNIKEKSKHFFMMNDSSDGSVAVSCYLCLIVAYTELLPSSVSVSVFVPMFVVF